MFASKSCFIPSCRGDATSSPAARSELIALLARLITCLVRSFSSAGRFVVHTGSPIAYRFVLLALYGDCVRFGYSRIAAGPANKVIELKASTTASTCRHDHGKA